MAESETVTSVSTFPPCCQRVNHPSPLRTRAIGRMAETGANYLAVVSPEWHSRRMVKRNQHLICLSHQFPRQAFNVSGGGIFVELIPKEFARLAKQFHLPQSRVYFLFI